VSSPEEVMEVIDEGKANRHVAVTSEYRCRVSVKICTQFISLLYCMFCMLMFRVLFSL